VRALPSPGWSPSQRRRNWHGGSREPAQAT